MASINELLRQQLEFNKKFEADKLKEQKPVAKKEPAKAAWGATKKAEPKKTQGE